MENPLNSFQWWSPALAAISATILMVTLFYIWYHHPNYGKNTGAKAYPFIGTLPEAIYNRERLLDWITDLIRTSPTMTTRVVEPGGTGGTAVFITANPANIEHILKTNFENYPKGEPFVTDLFDLLGHGILNVNGEMWRLQRKVASFEFTTQSLRNFMVGSVIDELHERLIPILSEVCEQGASIDLQDLLTRFTFDNICKLGFGMDPACLDPSLPNVKFAKAFDTATSLSRARFLSNPLIWRTMKALDLGSEKKLREAVEQINEFAMCVICTRRKQMLDNAARNEHFDEVEHLDLLSRFMGLAAEEKEENIDQNERQKDGIAYSDVFLRDIVVSFILAGRDTTSSGLSWFLWLLTCNRGMEDAICIEIAGILKSRKDDGGEAEVEVVDPSSQRHEGCFTYEELKKMHYLHAALTESLRLYPPVPIDLKVARTPDLWPDGTKISLKAGVAYHPYAMGRMERIWGADCLEYKPERWLKDGVFISENPYKFAVFQGGPRICLGKDFAMIQMKMMAASMLQHFTFSVPDSFSPTYGLDLTLSIKNGLPVTVHPRVPSMRLST